MENKYEVVFITRPDLGEDLIKGITQKVTDAVTNLQGVIVKIDDWGKRRMAYPIKKSSDGHYIFMNISCKPEASKEVERLLRLNEDVIRYQTIRVIEDKKTEAARKKKASSQPKETVQ